MRNDEKNVKKTKILIKLARRARSLGFAQTVGGGDKFYQMIDDDR